MKYIPVALAALLASCASTDSGPPPGFDSIFNGRDLDGWVIENDAKFSVRDGLLFVDRGTGWLRSEREYGDFVFRLDFRFLDAKANSGIFVRTGSTSNTDENGWPNNGYQVQCMDALDGRPVATMIPYGGEGFTDEDAESDIEKIKAAYKGVGEWNTYEIRCVGQEIRVQLNGVEVTHARDVRNATGHVGIQGENGRVEFRHLAIRPIR